MAEAADDNHENPFDFWEWETELEAEVAQTVEMERRPEDEIYGRSMGTAYRLGAFIVAKALAPAEAVTIPEAAQARVEFETSIKEGLGTDMELGGGFEVRDFDHRRVINGKVMAKDLKTAISEMTQAGLTCAIDTAKRDKRFLPQLIRSEWDHQNALTVDRMARGETGYNTRMVFSPFPEEGAADSGDEYWGHIGYVPHLRRGFLQLFHVAEDGEVITGSLSFDGCDKQRLREILGRHGVAVPQGEITDNWLRYALTGNYSETDAVAMALEIADEASVLKYQKHTNTVDVTTKYQAVMDRVFDESYVHICESLARGHQTDGARRLILHLANNSHHFNERYADALYRMRADGGTFNDADSIILHELLVYSTIEMMRALHLGRTTQVGDGRVIDQMRDRAQLAAIDPSIFQSLMSDFGAAGARSNRSYFACGLSMSLGQENDLNGGPQSAYGGVDNSQEGSGKKVMSCPFCSAKVFDDPCAKVLSCWDCRARVVNGKVEYKGDGGSKARAARKVAEIAHKAAETKPVEESLAAQVDAVFEERGLEFRDESHEEKPEAATSPAVMKRAGQLAMAQ